LRAELVQDMASLDPNLYKKFIMDGPEIVEGDDTNV